MSKVRLVSLIFENNSVPRGLFSCFEASFHRVFQECLEGSREGIIQYAKMPPFSRVFITDCREGSRFLRGKRERKL